MIKVLRYFVLIPKHHQAYDKHIITPDDVLGIRAKYILRVVLFPTNSFVFRVMLIRNTSFTVQFLCVNTKATFLLHCSCYCQYQVKRGNC